MPPGPTWLFHFTHVDHLTSILAKGMVSDSEVGDRLAFEAGDPGIKARRRLRSVPVGPGGAVADYVPFYFAPRSPMLYVISQGNVPSYTGAQRDLIYLCTTLEQLMDLGVAVVASDRNAATEVASFAATPEEWTAEGFIDWPLMDATIWKNDAEHPDRMERRMAECLAYRSVPWRAVQVVGTYDQRQARDVAAMVQGNAHQPRVVVKPGWYY